VEPGEPRLFDTEPGVRVLGRCHWSRGDAPLMLLVHGLEGSADSAYMRLMARAALEAGFHAIRLNVRTCGGTEHLAPTLYNSGLTVDLRAVVDQFSDRRVFLVGFSMGGNQALKLAGEWGDDAPPHVAGVCAISAPIDLAACARRLDEPRNWLYQRSFLSGLRARVRRKARLQPDLFSTAPLARVGSIVDFDHLVTAPAFGFRDAWDYYERSSARRFLAAIRIPTLLVQAVDDPFIPFGSFRLPDNPALRLLVTERGGHVSFLARGRQRFWAARQVLLFFQALQP